MIYMYTLISLIFTGRLTLVALSLLVDFQFICFSLFKIIQMEFPKAIIVDDNVHILTRLS